MTDSEIVKALKCCLRNNYADCKNCPAKDLSTDYLECRSELRKLALDLINRLKKEKDILNKKLTDAYLMIDKLRGDS
jgi:hypothetical protein